MPFSVRLFSKWFVKEPDVGQAVSQGAIMHSSVRSDARWVEDEQGLSELPSQDAPRHSAQVLPAAPKAAEVAGAEDNKADEAACAPSDPEETNQSAAANAEADRSDAFGSAPVGGRVVFNTAPSADGSGFDATVEYFGQNGTLAKTLNFSGIETVAHCFTPGTNIKVLGGERPVEDLRVGLKVLTRDNGFQTIRWIGERELSREELAQFPNLAPIEIEAGALGNGRPERTMRVSPHHRMLIDGPGAQMYFGTEEVLVAAAHLTCLPGVRRVQPETVTYIHILFDRHEIILADGAWSESFQPRDMSLAGLDDDTRAEVFALFPELQDIGEAARLFPAARQMVRGREAALLFP
ncbi:MAG: Hint domain-containing protein [Pseudomonadota bacterium]